MKSLFLAHWKAKITSLCLAVAIWYLIDASLRRPAPSHWPVPGEEVSPLPDTNPGSIVPIPGSGSTLDTGAVLPPPVRIEQVVERHLYSLHWMAAGDFEDSVLVFPGALVTVS